MQLQRLKSHRICSWKAVDPRGMMVQCHSEHEGLRTSTHLDVYVPVQVQVQRQEKTNVPAARQSGREQICSYSAFLFYSDLQWVG